MRHLQPYLAVLALQTEIGSSFSPILETTLLGAVHLELLEHSLEVRYWCNSLSCPLLLLSQICGHS